MQQLVDNVRLATKSIKYTLLLETMIFNMAGRFCSEYNGGQWDGLKVGNEWISKWPGDANVRLVNGDNFTDIEVNPQTAGAIITVLALNWLLWKAHEDVASAEVLNALNTIWEKTQDAVYDNGKALDIDLAAFARFLD